MTDNVRTFLGSEIAPSIVAAIEALPVGAEIVEFKAGENMQITCAFVPEDHEHEGQYPEFAFDGEGWVQIGWL